MPTVLSKDSDASEESISEEDNYFQDVFDNNNTEDNVYSEFLDEEALCDDDESEDGDYNAGEEVEFCQRCKSINIVGCRCTSSSDIDVDNDDHGIQLCIQRCILLRSLPEILRSWSEV